MPILFFWIKSTVNLEIFALTDKYPEHARFYQSLPHPVTEGNEMETAFEGVEKNEIV